MSAAVTRVQLRKELERFATKDDVAACATKDDLAIWAGALEHRIIGRVGELMQTQFTQLTADIARQINAILTLSRHEIVVLDEKYQDLPDRVTRLEAKVTP
jgi:hypothetical protein